VSADVNVNTVGQVYDAFGRGDIATILDAVTDDVDWGIETSSIVAPWYGMRHGKDAVARFFDGLSMVMDIEEFTPVSFAANDDDVLTVVRYKAKARTTGKTAGMHLHHFFHFRDGKIAFFRGTEDTVQIVGVLEN
jgi:uncharacterized protein